jgi:protein ImuB
LLPLPLAALRIAAETVEALAQVGLKRIADVIERPRAPLAARFGEEFLRRLDQALGRADEPITPRLPVPSYVAEQRFPEPILLEADVLATIAHLANELARLMERRGEGARRLEVALFRTDGKVRRIAVGTGAPLRDARRIAALFAERLAK